MARIHRRTVKKKKKRKKEKRKEKGLNDPDNHYGVVIHLEPDIPEYVTK